PAAGRLLVFAVTLAVLVIVRARLAAVYDQVPSFLPQQLVFFLIGIASALRLEWATATRRRLFACAAGVVLVGVALGGITNVMATSLWALTLVACAHTAPGWTA